MSAISRFLGSITNGWQRGSLAWKMRRARFQHFLDFIADLRSPVEREATPQGHRPVRILDIGGAEPFWASMDDLLGGLEITMVNLYPQTVTHPQITARTGDACNLGDFPDQSYDVVFSNSVIEHLGSFENQKRMAAEARRVARRYYIQTPNRNFPIEPHYLFPFAQFLPLRTRIWIGTHWKFGSYCTPGDKAAATRVADEIRLLSRKEMQSLFPDATLHLERLGPLLKSITAVGKC